MPASIMRASALAAMVAFSLAFAGCATPEESTEEEHAIAHAQELAWQAGPASLPAGARFVVLSGDPGAAGPFTMRLEAPAGYHVPPHTHPGTEHVTVLSGSAFVGMGETFDRAAATPLAPGDFFVMPPGMPHAFLAGDGPVVLQLHGEGPWDIQYLDAADDPRGG